MNEMVERVAKAIYAAASWQQAMYDTAEEGWRNDQEFTRERFRKMASAAIAAMRRPTGDMLGYLEDVLDYTPNLGEAEDYWQHMIDAALTDG